MKSRDLKFLLLSVVISLIVIAAFPQSRAHAQDCVDEDKNPIKCPTKEPPKDPPPQDPGNPPPQNNPNNNNQNSANTIILATATFTPTSTFTPKPTETKIPTATATKPVVCNCTNANPVTGGQAESSNPPAVPVPDPAPFSPWLTGLAGILIGLVLGALGGPAIFGGRTQPIPRPDPAPMGGGGSSFGNNVSAYPVKWEAPGDSAATGAEKQDFGDDESTRFVKLDGQAPSTRQVSEVHVRGYDPGHQKEIVGSATASSDLGGSSFHKGVGEHLKQDDPASILDNTSQSDMGSGGEHMKKLDDHD